MRGRVTTETSPTDQPLRELVGNLRLLMALQLGKLAGWLANGRPVPRDEQVSRLLDGLGEITSLLDARHPACQVAIRTMNEFNRPAGLTRREED